MPVRCSANWGPVHTTPEEFENGALRFSVDGKHFENGAFRKQWRHDNHVICLPESSSNTNPKRQPKWWCHVDFATWVEQKPWYAHSHGCTQSFLTPVIVAFSNFSGVVWMKNIWWVFRVKLLYQLLRRSVDGAWAMMPHIGSEISLLSSYLPWGVKWCEVYMK